MLGQTSNIGRAFRHSLIDGFSKLTCRNHFGQITAYIDDFKRFFVGWTSDFGGLFVQIGFNVETEQVWRCLLFITKTRCRARQK